MSKEKLLEILKEILGTCEDAYSCCPEGDIGTDTSDTMYYICLLYTSPSPRDQRGSRMPSSA